MPEKNASQSIPSPKPASAGHKIKIVILSILALIVAFAIYKIVYFEIFKTCGNCGNPGNRNVAVTSYQFTDNDNGKTVTVLQGKALDVVLNSTYWQFQPLPNATVLKQTQNPVYNPLMQAVPGTGAGTATVRYEAVAVGQVDIIATRTNCGGASACTPDQQKFKVTVNVVTGGDTANYTNYKMVLTTSNGSLPPPYHKETALTVAKDASGTITAKVESGDGKMIASTKNVTVSNADFIAWIQAALNVNQPDDSLNGCTGGSSESLQIFQGDQTVINTFTYHCANGTSNQSFDNFSPNVESLLLANS